MPEYNGGNKVAIKQNASPTEFETANASVRDSAVYRDLTQSEYWDSLYTATFVIMSARDCGSGGTMSTKIHNPLTAMGCKCTHRVTLGRGET
jgi:hypothetical protein